ncbi:MAG TPA: FKBP-type peptidyl-prolyl cis-trans isomerase [Chitinophagaceae bacterium]|nr:FKBP-type peptidyl-prolyl cis-trans isomerase [Chitinophagaceae bacterium]
MKQFLTFEFLLFTFLSVSANNKDSLIYYPLPDSVNAVSFLADISVGTITTKREVVAGIRTDVVKLSLEADKKEREVVFEFPAGAAVMAAGHGIDVEKDELSWRHEWEENKEYRLMIATAGDSAGNFALYTGYIFLPNEKKWKLIGTCKISGQWNSLKQPAVFHSRVKKDPLLISIDEVWCQRSNGSWKNLSQKNLVTPVVSLLSHVDSLEQFRIDTQIIHQAVSENKIDAKQFHSNIYYTIMKEGTGRQVAADDTVTIYYKGYLLRDGSLFDETKDKPATFPLKRLIVGWQVGVPLCKVGGKIRIIIPSALAYSIRTRAAKIPPNSILVFEVEVVEAKSSQ